MPIQSARDTLLKKLRSVLSKKFQFRKSTIHMLRRVSVVVATRSKDLLR